ncbi:FMN-binding negative transcriptional regulator [Pseudosulfitobacter koreensis]|uniref:FMN-binding negative transcriptional regulator n=1 Tax=Pseudosulfitobacter koreensis TaxID=2968472 RepID=A0ABT1Z105_9RHOB|nr:FMN-binding negative transcriptional regulator [Pseudosulfitobacter koreense]MCR8826808.1 FMN-binding negative transcriptional regulator [Pseudosulfitobacter koreense]
MHPNPIFHDADAARNLAFARDRGFGVLAINAPDGPLISHVPFLLSEDGGSVALHLVRSNPIARLLSEPRAVRLAVSGGDSYVSPDWYEVPDQVPTWNYVAVHLTGTLEQRPQDEMRALLDAQSAHFEEQLQPKTPWTAAKMSADVLDRMMRQIVPCRMTVTGVDGTWKLSQNKSDDVRERAADGVEAYGLGSDLAVLAALMRGAGA